MINKNDFFNLPLTLNTAESYIVHLIQNVNKSKDHHYHLLYKSFVVHCIAWFAIKNSTHVSGGYEFIFKNIFLAKIK